MPPRASIVLAALIVAALFLGFTYGGLARLRHRVDAASYRTSVHVQRRHDLVLNLVNAVRGSMDFEQETLTRVLDARTAAVAAHQARPRDAARAAAAEVVLDGALRELIDLVENYPDLRGNEKVMRLRDELTTTENQIGVSRRHYDVAVHEFNTAIRTFPNVLIAAPLRFRDGDSRVTVAP